jgi:hypothetical protein
MLHSSIYTKGQRGRGDVRRIAYLLSFVNLDFEKLVNSFLVAELSGMSVCTVLEYRED